MSQPEKKTARILIVDDHPIVREGLTFLISNQPDLEVCGATDNASDALRLLASARPALVVIDISLKSGSGIELIKQIKARDERVKMLVSSMHDETLFAERVLRAGAMGYINKAEATHEIINAIRQILGGQIYLSPYMSNRLLNGLADHSAMPDQAAITKLSDREMEVFGLIGQGLTTSQIAEHLHLSIKTIETHRENIKKKLNLETANELTRSAMQWMMEQSQPKPPPAD